MPDDRLTGERIAYHRKRLGLSQVEFAGLVGRSESWVSQVERGVRPVDRMSVLQRVADVLSVSVAELTGGDDTPVTDERPEAFDTIRLALTGHPAIASVIGTVRPAPAKHIEALRRQHAEIWELVHASRYTELAPILAALIPGLEAATRTAASQQDRAEARELLGDTYQATAAMMAKIGETDAAWIAADRAGFCAEAAGSPSRSRRACSGWPTCSSPWARSTRPTTSPPASPRRWNRRSPANRARRTVPLRRAHLILAVAAARDNQRGRAHEHLDTARKIAGQLGEDRDDYGTEFGPSNVAIHAVNIAVELGDAGQAIELAQHVTPGRPVTRTAGPVPDGPRPGPRHATPDRRSTPRPHRSRTHRPRGNPRPLRRPGRHPRPPPALRPTTTTRTPRPRRTIRRTALAWYLPELTD